MPNDNNNNCKRIKLAFSSRAGQRETSEYDRLVDTYLLVLTIEGGCVWEGGGVIWATISICITLPRNSKDLSAEVTRLQELISDKTNRTHTKCREMGVVVCEERGGARGVSQF